MIDAYRQPYIPFYLTTEEFFTWCASGSRPAASWSSTSATREGSVKLTKVMVATMRSVFGDDAVHGETGEPTNTMLVGTDGPFHRPGDRAEHPGGRAAGRARERDALGGRAASSRCRAAARSTPTTRRRWSG